MRWHSVRRVVVAFSGVGWFILSLLAAEPSRRFFSPAFPNGVASGDVDATSAVLWARTAKPGPVTFQYSTHSNLVPVVATLVSNVLDSNRPTKIEIHELNPNTSYYYRVTDAAGESLDGQFRTSSKPGAFHGLRFGVTGDWQGQLAPFVAVADVPDRNLDFLVALGDTIYADVFSPVLPDRFAQTLDEFRAKYGENLSERMGLNVMARVRGTTAIYATVDDHEWTNGLAGGAVVTAGEYPNEPPGVTTVNQTAFFRTGMQAFLEYHPLTESIYQSPEDPRTHGRVDLYRTRRFGSDAALFLLDTRSFRDPGLTTPKNPFDAGEAARFESISLEVNPDTGAVLPHRTLLGATQFSTLTRDLLQAEADGVIWKFIIIPDPIQNLSFAGADDRYEGYAAERRELLKLIHTTPIPNVVFISADLHGTLINNLTYRSTPGGTNLDSGAFEIITGAAAHDKPFGPTAFDFAAGVKVTAEVNLLDFLLNAVGVPNRVAFDSFPLAEKDRLFQRVLDLLLNAAGLDPLGFDGSAIDAHFDIGRPVAAHSYGWTEFEVDRETHDLAVTTRGIPAYTAANLTPEIASWTSQILNQFHVHPRSVTRTIQAHIQIASDGVTISWHGDVVLESRATLDSDAPWELATEDIAIDGADYVARAKVSAQQRFFRLRPRTP